MRPEPMLYESKGQRCECDSSVLSFRLILVVRIMREYDNKKSLHISVTKNRV